MRLDLSRQVKRRKRRKTKTRKAKARSAQDKIDEVDDVRLPVDPTLYGLDKDVYGIMNLNPPVLAVARNNTKQITKAKVIKHEQGGKNGGMERTEITYNLMWITPIIDAIPIKVVKNENPLEINKVDYTVTFVSKEPKIPFTIGPTSIRAMIEDLTDRGLVPKKIGCDRCINFINSRLSTKEQN